MPEKVPEYCFLWINHWSMCMTKAEWSGWMQAIGTVLAVVAAFVVPLVYERRTQAKVRQGHLLTVATDVRVTERQAGIYLQSKYRLPAYRVPLYGTRTALPALLADGALSTAQATALVQFYVDATSFNFALDLAQRLKESKGLWLNEVRRVRLKAGHLVKGDGKTGYDDAIRALRVAGLPEESLQQIPVGIRVEEELDGADEEEGA